MAKFPLSVLLVVVLTAFAATKIAATNDAPVKSPPMKHTPIDDLCPFRFNYTSCWVSIANVEGCALQLIGSITGINVGAGPVGAHCCNAITDVSDKCFSIFGTLFAPLLRFRCNGFLPEASLAAQSPESFR